MQITKIFQNRIFYYFSSKCDSFSTNIIKGKQLVRGLSACVNFITRPSHSTKAVPTNVFLLTRARVTIVIWRTACNINEKANIHNVTSDQAIGKCFMYCGNSSERKYAKIKGISKILKLRKWIEDMMVKRVLF